MGIILVIYFYLEYTKNIFSWATSYWQFACIWKINTQINRPFVNITYNGIWPACHNFYFNCLANKTWVHNFWLQFYLYWW